MADAFTTKRDRTVERLRNIHARLTARPSFSAVSPIRFTRASRRNNPRRMELGRDLTMYSRAVDAKEEHSTTLMSRVPGLFNELDTRTAVLDQLFVIARQNAVAEKGYETFYAYEGDGEVQLVAPPLTEKTEICRNKLVSGRLLACRCFRSKYLSTTLRGRNEVNRFRPRCLEDFESDSVPWAKPGYIRSAWAPPIYEAAHPERPISIENICSFLYNQLLINKDSHEGIIAISGSTSSGKSIVARGLVYNYLQKRSKRFKSSDKGASRRSPHLLTIEDPIEEFYYTTKKGEPVPPYISQTLGLDYTPREIGYDTPSLKAALNDALRQTPKVVYIGEIRTAENLGHAIDFAATGHLVVFTMHAGSLVETMDKLMQAIDANTPVRRGQLAERLLAVVNLCKLPELDKQLPTQVLVPTLWKRTPSSQAGLVADGLSSVLPESDADEPTVGRRAVLNCLIQYASASPRRYRHF